MEKSSGEHLVRAEIAIVAGPREWGDTRESWLARVPRRVSTVTYRTVKALWYAEIQDPNHWAAREIRKEAERIKARRNREQQAATYESMAAGMLSRDEDFHSEDIRALVHAARLLRTMDRA